MADTLLHPGDARPEISGLDTMMVAMAAPWQNTPQLEEYLRKTKPDKIIGYHDVTLSELGQDFAQKTLEKIAESYGGKSIALKPGESVEI